jgi:hypothetical protein
VKSVKESSQCELDSVVSSNSADKPENICILYWPTGIELSNNFFY